MVHKIIYCSHHSSSITGCLNLTHQYNIEFKPNERATQSHAKLLQHACPLRCTCWVNMGLGFRIGLLVLEHSHPEKLSYSILSSFFWESFNLWRPLLMIIIYHQIKILISFWCRRGLNPRSLIQSSEILPVELIGTYSILSF